MFESYRTAQEVQQPVKDVLRMCRILDMKALDTATRRLMKRAEGFTLPEVLITILIMGIVFSITTASWFGIVESRQVDSATNQLAADMRLAHASATNRLAPARVRFNNSGATVTCNGQTADYCLVTPTASGALQEEQRNFESNFVRLTSRNLFILGGVSVIEFQPNGSVTTPGATLGLVGGVTENCPASTPTAVTRLQVSVDGDPAHCITFNTSTSRIKID